MENPLEVTPPQGTQGEVVSIPKKDFDDLQNRAGVSSQNYERVKKLEQEKAELEAQLQELSQVPSNPVEVSALQKEISEVKEQLSRGQVIERYPMLKDKMAELEEFRNLPDNKGMNLNTAAKAFLVERGLLEAPRKGLETPTGGPRTPVRTGMTAEEVKTLRENDYRKYTEMLTKGQIQISE